MTSPRSTGGNGSGMIVPRTLETFLIGTSYETKLVKKTKSRSLIGFSSASHLSKINNVEHLTQPPRRKVALELTPLERSVAATRKVLNFQTTKNAEQHNQRKRKKVALAMMKKRLISFW